MSKRVTMQDIADQLNISKNSVSQALAGKPGVSEGTRMSVRRVARDLGYHNPKSSKHTYKEPLKGKIALIASEFAFSLKNFFGAICLSIEREISLRGMTLQIQSIDHEKKENLYLPDFVQNKTVDGIIILSHISTKYIQKVLACGIPTVLVDQHHPNIEADAILTNNRFGAYIAVQHLINLGHTHIAFVGDVGLSPSYQERMEGYLLALRDYDIDPKRQYIFNHTAETVEMIKETVKNAQHLDSIPTAWFCVNDGLGFLVLTCLQQQGIDVPDQASVCSYDNGQLSQISSPKITTMDVDLDLFGRKAVEQLCWRMENQEAAFQEILLPSKLIVRESTATAMGTMDKSNREGQESDKSDTS
ncbi:LacI family DNA-binding transcriptional regulator [Sporolactobacillus sp. THM19-2]|uniref:LacI family DNA-binding transcriptional regulator n=1 Tax=Sporolactobacillus sp. THM19-2 TaxID=2511171 RepID=UPI001022889A|nr:LacI family DNA-binding transcriptional regulator [Sporolactobacillus sp. THM19-2]RYL86665.1 LacI family DNA-binding transcriptional regulator [Sporolactobacillus sp. THM19-2]